MDNISIACEMFTKFAGYTEEYIVFNSAIYHPEWGIKLDELFSITPNYHKVNVKPNVVLVCTSSIDSSLFNSSSALSATYIDGIYKHQIITEVDYLSVINFNLSLSANFENSRPTVSETYFNTFDYDIMDYRKVIDVVDFEEGSNTGINTLFTVEQSVAQQTYYTHAMGNAGFDLVTWYILKNWLDVREKTLALRKTYVFDQRTQCLQIYPTPRGTPTTSQFYGIISCYVERPLRDIIKEPWVYKYALALSKISTAMVRGKYTGMPLFGGGALNYDLLLSSGMAEKEALEQDLYTGATAGLGSAPPAMFYVG
jgi:hypothetical protein